MKDITGEWVRIKAFKHDGAFHRLWSHNYVVLDDEQYYVLASSRSYVIENNGRRWHTKEPSLFIFSKTEWFNVIAMFKNDGTITYYVNIASPSIYDRGFIKFVDYDLDIKLFGDGSTRLLDVGEYKRHAKLLGYNEDIRNILTEAVSHVYRLIQNHVFPFDDNKIRQYFRKFERD